MHVMRTDLLDAGGLCVMSHFVAPALCDSDSIARACVDMHIDISVHCADHNKGFSSHPAAGRATECGHVIDATACHCHIKALATLVRIPWKLSVNGAFLTMCDTTTRCAVVRHDHHV
jgi:hypothetical protein